MALNIFRINPWVIFLIASIITAGIIIYLTLTEKILKRKVVIKQKREENSPGRRIKLLMSSQEDVKNKLRKINSIAKEIFRDSFHLDTNLSYYELAEKFKKRNKRNATKFCEDMFKILYSGEELKQKKLNELIKILNKIEEDTQKEKKFTTLEKNVKKTFKPIPQKSIFQKLLNREEKFITKLAKGEKTIQGIETKPQQIPTEVPKTKSPQTKVIPQISYKTKRERIKNLPLIKLFRFRKPKTTLDQEIPQKEIIKQPIEQKSKINFKQININKKLIEEDLAKEIKQKQEQINHLKTQAQMSYIQKSSENTEVEKTNQEIPDVWPPVRIRPKMLNTKRKIPEEISRIFEKTNKKIEELEKEIKHKQIQIHKIKTTPIEKIQKLPKQYHFPETKKPSTILRKFFPKLKKNTKIIDQELKQKQEQIQKIKTTPIQKTQKLPKTYNFPKTEKQSPILKRFFEKMGKSTKKIDKDIDTKRNQIKIMNIRKHTYSEQPNYSEPKVVAPKKHKIDVKPKNRKIRQKDSIHNLDNLDRIQDLIKVRRSYI